MNIKNQDIRIKNLKMKFKNKKIKLININLKFKIENSYRSIKKFIQIK
jgi:hypothetical protein